MKSKHDGGSGPARSWTHEWHTVLFGKESHQAGNVALDGDGENRPFTVAFLNHIETPGFDIANVMRAVRLEVLMSTTRKQVPWSNPSLAGSFFFKDEPKAKGNATDQTEGSKQADAVGQRSFSGHCVQIAVP